MQHVITNNGRLEVTFKVILAAPFYRVRLDEQQRLRYTALNGTSPSARPRNSESSIRVLGDSDLLDSSQCLAWAVAELAPQICDTST
jgi:hypothetical protein